MVSGPVLLSAGGQSFGQAPLHQAASPPDVARQEAETGPVLPAAPVRAGRREGDACKLRPKKNLPKPLQVTSCSSQTENL